MRGYGRHHADAWAPEEDMMGGGRHQGDPQAPRGVFGWDVVRGGLWRHPSAAACRRDIFLGVAVEDIEGVIDRIPEECLVETP